MGEEERSQGISIGKIVGVAILAVIILVCIFGSFRIVGAGERGVLLNFNAVQDVVYGEGFHWKVPIYQKIIKMDVKTQKAVKENVDGASNDLQNVESNVTINYRLDYDYVNKLYQELQKNYEVKVINPAIEEFVKKTTAEFTAEELITRRSEVKENLKLAITESLAKRGIIVEDVFITNFQFSETFDAAIEAKVTAEQAALEAKNKLEQIKFEAQQKIATATAEAEAIRIQAQAITQQGGAEYVNLQAVLKWNGILPTQMIPGGAVPFINLR